MFKRILIPIDLAEPDISGPSMDQVAQLAKASDAKVRLIHVRRFMIEAALAYLPPSFFDDEERDALRDLEAMAESLNLPDDRTSVISPTGSVYDHIISAGTEFKADLIALGSHRPAMITYLLGSNAARIVLHATCSVLVVR
jgi:universal stress protein F